LALTRHQHQSETLNARYFLLFSLFANDVGQCIDKPHDGDSSAGVSYTSNDTTSQTISFVMYADDLTLFDTSAGRPQDLVNRLASYANKKGLIVNVQKRLMCVVMVFKTPRMHSLRPQIKLYGQAVPNVQRFKFLGLWLMETSGCGDNELAFCCGSA
jgi:hypothetical protein